MRIHVLPSSDAYGRGNYTNTVQLKVNIDKIKEFITDDEILDLLSDDSYAVWGIKKVKVM